MDNNPIAEITTADLTGKGVSYLPDVPANLTASQLKAKFEEITKEVVIPKINEIAGAVNRNTENKAELDEIPAVPEWAMQPEKPQYSAEEVGALAAGSLPDAINAALAQAKASGEFDGEDGFSPTIAISSITGGHRVTITDVAGTRYFDVMNGASGGSGSSGGEITKAAIEAVLTGVITSHSHPVATPMAVMSESAYAAITPESGVLYFVYPG